MVFPYWRVNRGLQTRLLPLVPLTVRGPDTEPPSTFLDVLALVDSGAEHNVLGGDVAQRLGYSLKDGEPATLVGIGEQEVPGRLMTIDLQLGKHRWSAPVIVATTLGRHVVLGQAGFFAYFTVTFRHHLGEMDIKAVKQLAGRG